MTTADLSTLTDAPSGPRAVDDPMREVLRRLEALEGKVSKSGTEDRLAMVVF